MKNQIENGLTLVKKVWQTDNKIIIPEENKVGVEVARHIAAMFSIGPFFYIILNLYTHKAEFISPQTKNVLGFHVDELSLEELFNLMHPEDVQRVHEKEAVAFDFAKNHIPFEEVLHYSISYLHRMRTSDDVWKTLLYHGKPVSLSKDGKIQYIVGVYTDVSHLDIEMDQTVSLISSTRPSYHSLETTPPYKFRVNDFSKQFTRREKEIIAKIAEGKTIRGIAGELYLSSHTIHAHKKNIFKKAGCRNIAQLVTKCFREGLI